MSYDGGELEALTLLDLSDREILLILRDCGGLAPDWATAVDVAAHLRLTGENPHRSVSSRLSWLRRYGAVEREFERDEKGNIKETRHGKPVYAQGWRLSDLGLAIAIGKLTKRQEESIVNMGDGSLLLMMRAVSRRVASAETGASRLFDREYRHGVGRR